MSSVPYVRLTVEGMQHSIVMALNNHADDLHDQMEAAVEEAVATFNFGAEIRRSAHNCIAEAIRKELETSFQFGEGRKFINAAVRAALEEEGHEEEGN